MHALLLLKTRAISHDLKTYASVIACIIVSTSEFLTHDLWVEKSFSCFRPSVAIQLQSRNRPLQHVWFFIIISTSAVCRLGLSLLFNNCITMSCLAWVTTILFGNHWIIQHTTGFSSLGTKSCFHLSIFHHFINYQSHLYFHHKLSLNIFLLCKILLMDRQYVVVNQVR